MAKYFYTKFVDNDNNLKRSVKSGHPLKINPIKRKNLRGNFKAAQCLIIFIGRYFYTKWQQFTRALFPQCLDWVEKSLGWCDKQMPKEFSLLFPIIIFCTSENVHLYSLFFENPPSVFLLKV